MAIHFPSLRTCTCSSNVSWVSKPSISKRVAKCGPLAALKTTCCWLVSLLNCWFCWQLNLCNFCISWNPPHTHLWAQWHTRSSLVPTSRGIRSILSHPWILKDPLGFTTKMKSGFRVLRLRHADFFWDTRQDCVWDMFSSLMFVMYHTVYLFRHALKMDWPSKLNQVSGRHLDPEFSHLRVWVQQTENTFAARAPGYGEWDIWRKRDQWW